jgi:muramoyltetrapeptide carboxypeptidase
MRKNVLLPGDTIGVIAPSRPIENIKKEIENGIYALEQLGFKVKKSKNIDKRFYFSAGTPEERAADIHEMFADPEVKAIICATGGSSSNQLLELIDFNLVEDDSKIFLGYSDISILLLAMYKKSGINAFYGPTVYEMSMLTPSSKDFLLDMLKGEKEQFKYPSELAVIRPGKIQGMLIGGLLSRINSLIGTDYIPDFNNSILFWEEVNMSPAMIDFNLETLRLAGVFDNIKGMIVGHLSGCTDSKYPEDNRSIEDIILDRTTGYNFPIIKTDYFGHDINDFYTIPLGKKASIDTDKKEFTLLHED